MDSKDDSKLLRKGGDPNVLILVIKVILMYFQEYLVRQILPFLEKMCLINLK